MPSRSGIGNAEVRLSEKILDSVIKAWTKGKEALAFLVVGTAIILLACFLALVGHEWIAIAFLATGVLIIGVVVYKFYVDAIVPTVAATEEIKNRAEVMDAIQEAALELTNIITQLNDFALQNAETIVTGIEAARVGLSWIPGGGKILELDYFKKSDEFAKGIRRVAAGSKDTIADVRDSITKADITRIKAQIESLKAVKTLIETELLA